MKTSVNPSPVGSRQAKFSVTALAALCLLATLLGTAGLAEPRENSVLVSTKKASERTRSDTRTRAETDPQLEPIAQISDFEPDLAEPAAAPAVDDRKARRMARRRPAAKLPVAESELEATDDITGFDGDAQDTDFEGDGQFGEELARAAEGRGRNAQSAPVQPINEELLPLFEKGKRPEPAKFNGIQPGGSTRDELVEKWGAPEDSFYTDGGEVLTYETAPFRRIDVLVADEIVDVIKVELEKPLDPSRLAEQLRLDRFEPATVHDLKGQALGHVYPERGVLFMFLTDDESKSRVARVPRVSHIVIQPLDADAFALRAENRLHGPYANTIRDLKCALLLNPEMAHAHWLLAEVYLAIGKVERAEQEAATAVDLDGDNDAFLLRWAATLEAMGQYDEAVSRTREVIDYEDTPPVVQARALHQLGRLARSGDQEISGKTIQFHNQAIEIADSLADSRNIKERRAAKQLLVDAHLAIARTIASQEFDNQLESISQWIGRASGFAEEFIENDNGSLLLRMEIADSALAALAEMKPTTDPAPWIKEAQEAADQLMLLSDDVEWQHRLRWQLGVSYFHAVRIEHTRRESVNALRYGQQAIENLAEGAKSRQAVPEAEHLVGRLYFHVGAVHAVHKNDHAKAVTWYDKAVPMLTAELPRSELVVPRRQGEALVSMGVSYWKDGERRQALELTEAGAELVEKAVAAGVLENDALAVPYGNLATMHKELGNIEDANNYARRSSLAAKGTATQPGSSRRQTANVAAQNPPRSGQRVATGRNIQDASRTAQNRADRGTNERVARRSNNATQAAPPTRSPEPRSNGYSSRPRLR